MARWRFIPTSRVRHTLPSEAWIDWNLADGLFNLTLVVPGLSITINFDSRPFERTKG